MLEQILKRFISEDAKVILAAMEKWGETRDIGDIDMFSGYRKYASLIDRRVLVLAENRLTCARKKKEAVARSLDTAAKILMGETFTPARPAAPWTPGPIQQAAIQQQIAMQQELGQYAQQGPCGARARDVI